MTYIEGFVVPVPAVKKDAYRQQAAGAAPLFKEFGVLRHVEAWGDEVADGKVTDFKRAVKAKDDEVVVFSWFEYPDRAARDAANAKIMSDPRMEALGAEMPFDGKRMIMGGFEAVQAGGPGGPMGYTDGVVIAVPTANKADYIAMARSMAALFARHGATRVVDGWGDDVPDGKVTDFKGAVQAKSDETVVFSWIEWPSKAVRDAGWGAVMQDPEMKDSKMPFDGSRMIYGGFAPIFDV